MSEWQPIETIPKDGKAVLGCLGNVVWPCFWHTYQQRVKVAAMGSWSEWDPTHWMPMPPPPELVKPRPADPSVFYWHVPAVGQRVRNVAHGLHGTAESFVVSEALQKPLLGVRYDGENGTCYAVQVDAVVAVGDNPRFILFPAEAS